MNELKEKRKELEYEIWELETESQKLLNFGNVPYDNWAKVTEMLIKRSQKIEALKAITDTIETVCLNAL
jgi:hypothetical protein